ncbi:MAG: PDZ domain-containing protein [Alphaproteobacteria bacterium]|nr:PDZ domain-containing protein [Alphaproteobacteria bacterium]
MYRLFLLILIFFLSSPLSGRAAFPVTSSIETTYSSIVKKTAPAIVSISTSKSMKKHNELLGNDPFFTFYFGSHTPLKDLPEKARATSLGSGVIVSPTGIVITCVHVIANAEKILVTLNDNREFEGEVIAKDNQNDLVAIQLKDVPSTFPLPSISLGNSDVEVGDFILAIGNPFGVGQTVTSGIISAIARNVRGRMLIQTDASINPGNSGGALVSMQGNLIGVPNAILSKTGSSHGIGFAIPQAVIRTLLESIPNGGIIVRPWAGITVQRLTSKIAKSLNLPIPQGVLISALHAASPALLSGLTTGDIITSLNGQSISNPEEFIYRIQSVPIGQNIILSILRNGQAQQLTFQPIVPPAVPAPNQQVITRLGGILRGLEVANLSPALISQYQLPFTTPEKGVIITNPGTNVLAQKLQLKPGDILEQINNYPIESVEDLLTKASTLRSLIIRQGDKRIEVNKNS